MKTRWENLRKAYVREHKKVKQGYGTLYYLYNDMHFLDKYVFHIQSASKLYQKSEGGIAKIDNSTADKEKKTQDILPSPTTATPSNSSLVQSNIFLNELKLMSDTKKSLLEEKKEIADANCQKIQESIVSTVEVIKKIVTDEEDQDEQYFLPIINLLKRIPPTEIDECMAEIISIIQKYRNINN